jgi:glycosyltransferase involved in cell wall biosynthesis
MACGVPVIAAPTPGLAENLGDAGKLVDWQDVDGYVRALQTLALPGPYAAACRKALARAGQQQRLYDVEEAAWLEAVQRVARNSPRSSPKTPVLV